MEMLILFLEMESKFISITFLYFFIILSSNIILHYKSMILTKKHNLLMLMKNQTRPRRHAILKKQHQKF